MLFVLLIFWLLCYVSGEEANAQAKQAEENRKRAYAAQKECEYQMQKIKLEQHPLALILKEKFTQKLDELCAVARTERIGQAEHDFCWISFESDKQYFILESSRHDIYSPYQFCIVIPRNYSYDDLTDTQAQIFIENLYHELKNYYPDEPKITISDNNPLKIKIDLTSFHPRLIQIS